jgi:putative transposase
LGSEVSKADLAWRSERTKEVFKEIAIHHGFETDTVEISEDHVHVFLSFPPRYSISKVGGILKSIGASVIFKEYPEVKKELWGGEFWGDGYFARTVGSNVTADIIRKYIQYCREQEKSLTQLELFQNALPCGGLTDEPFYRNGVHFSK